MQILLDFWVKLLISLSDKHFVERFVTEVLSSFKLIDKSSQLLIA